MEACGSGVGMPRRLRGNSADFVYHVLKRRVGLASLSRKVGDYASLVKPLRGVR